MRFLNNKYFKNISNAFKNYLSSDLISFEKKSCNALNKPIFDE